MEVRVLVCCYELQAVGNNKLENLQQHCSSLGAAFKKIPKKNNYRAVRVLVK